MNGWSYSSLREMAVVPPSACRCDRCNGGTLVQRDDDKLEVVKQRLITYEKETMPVIRLVDDG